MGRPREAKSTESADAELMPGAKGYRCRDMEVYARLNDYVQGHGYSVDACIEAALVSMSHNRKLARIICPSCQTPHLDLHARAIELHSVHTCGACGHEW